MDPKNISVNKESKVQEEDKNTFFTEALQDSNDKPKKDTLIESETNKEWLDGEDYSGQLAVDVYQTKDEVIIKSTIAGVKPEDIDVSINNDMITIRGKREKDYEVRDEDYFYRECYWGGFSRSIILPCEVKVDKIKASIKNGVLAVILPKDNKVNKVTVVKVKEE